MPTSLLEKRIYQQVIDSLQNIKFTSVKTQKRLSKLARMFYRYYEADKPLPAFVKQADLLNIAQNSMGMLSILALNPKVVERLMGETAEEKAKWVIFVTTMQAKTQRGVDEDEFLTRIKSHQRKVDFALHAKSLWSIAKKIDVYQTAIFEKLYNCKKNNGEIKLGEHRAKVIKKELSVEGMLFSEKLNKYLATHKEASARLHNLEVEYEKSRHVANTKISNDKMKGLGDVFFNDYRATLAWLAELYQAKAKNQIEAHKFDSLIHPDEKLLLQIKQEKELMLVLKMRGEMEAAKAAEKRLEKLIQPLQHLQAELLLFAAENYVDEGHPQKKSALEKLRSIDPTQTLDAHTRTFYKRVLIANTRKRLKAQFKPQITAAKTELKTIEMDMHTFLKFWINKLEHLIHQRFIEQRIFNQTEWQSSQNETRPTHHHQLFTWTNLQKNAMTPATYLHELLHETTKMKVVIEKRFDSKDFLDDDSHLKPTA